MKRIEDVKIVRPPSQKEDWYNFSISEIEQKLSTSKKGLSSEDADLRLKKLGKNELPRTNEFSLFDLFIKQFNSSLIYILLFASVISFLIRETIDAYVILATVLVNVSVGFFQEYKAQNALSSLQKIITHCVWVVRDGVERKIESNTLVPGDVVLLYPGDKIASDGRLFEAENLKVNESSITGESEHVDKAARSKEGYLTISDQYNMVFSGTMVTEGRGRFYAVRTGEDTEIGKIAKLVKESKEVRTPLQKKLDSFSKMLGIVVLFLCLILVIVGIFRGYEISEMFVISVALAVSSIPEGLAVGVTVILALGMQRILKEKSLVRKLVAAETLGSVNVICVDKTGTVTMGIMKVVEIATENHNFETQNNVDTDSNILKKSIEIKKLNQIGVYCNDAIIASAEPKQNTKEDDLLEKIISGSPTEQALLAFASDSEFFEANLSEQRTRFDEISFDSKKKFMATLNSWTKKQNTVYLKGAPEKIISMCSRYQDGKSVKNITEKKRAELLKIYEKMSSKGLRVIAGAYKGVGVDVFGFDEIPSWNEDCIFVGLWGIKDPIRPEAKETLMAAKSAGIRTIIITGDNKNTAFAIAREIGMDPDKEEIIDGHYIASMSSSELASLVKKIKVFSRATPQDKLRIIEALQKNGDIVAMTGDGVNDAPALSRSDIGVALGSGTDVAKNASDLILLDNNFSTIVSAIRQGRVIFDNIKKIVLYLLSHSFAEIIIIMTGLFFGWPLVLLPAQILWINLVTDGLPHLALTQEPEEDEIMNERPLTRREPILDFESKFLIFSISVITAISTMVLFVIIFKTTGNLEKARTVAFVTLGINSLLYVFSVRSVRHSVFEINQFSNKWLIWAVLGGFLIQVIAVYNPFLQKVLKTEPISIREWFIIFSVCLWVIGFIEIIKHYFISQRVNIRENSI